MKEPEIPGRVWTVGQERRVDAALVHYHQSTWGTSINSPDLLGPHRQARPFSTLQPGEGACLPATAVTSGSRRGMHFCMGFGSVYTCSRK